MVEELLEQPGSAYDPVLFEFTTDVTNDQKAEIERMNALLVGPVHRPARGVGRRFRQRRPGDREPEARGLAAQAGGLLRPGQPGRATAERLKPKKDKAADDERR